MKILHVITSMDPKTSGMCHVVKTMIKYASCDQVMHRVVCLDDPNEDFLRNNTFKIYALGNGKTFWNFNFKLKLWMLQHLNKYDRVIVHGLWQYHSLIIYQVWPQVKNENAKLYVMPHGMLDPYFKKAEGRKLKAMRLVLFWEFVERHLIHTADALLFSCSTERLLAHMSFNPYFPKSEYIIGLGVEEPPEYTVLMKEEFNVACPEIIDSHYVLFLSRIHPKKGVDLLIKAYLKLDAPGISLPKLIIAGPGLETPYGQKMVQLAGNNKNIFFTGMLSGGVKWGAFYGCEAFILPSHQENYGISVIEAMACKKPVLITDQINISKQIEESNAGLVTRNTEDEVFQMLKAWFGLSPIIKDLYGKNALKAYQEHFSPDNAARSFLMALGVFIK